MEKAKLCNTDLAEAAALISRALNPKAVQDLPVTPACSLPKLPGQQQAQHL
jgi:hypothetical protein